MQQSILIKGKPFYYEATELSLVDTMDISFNQARSILFKAKELLESQNIKFYLIYGTLLGAIREHSFISHDYDVDIYIDDVEELKSIIPFLYSQDFKLCRVTEPRIYSFMYKGIYIDIYIKRKAPFPFNLWCYWLGGGIVPKHYINKSKKIIFLGEEFLIPENPERLMKFFYGQSWRTPIKGDHGRNSIYIIHYYRIIKKHISRLFK